MDTGNSTVVILLINIRCSKFLNYAPIDIYPWILNVSIGYKTRLYGDNLENYRNIWKNKSNIYCIESPRTHVTKYTRFSTTTRKLRTCIHYKQMDIWSIFEAQCIILASLIPYEIVVLRWHKTADWYLLKMNR